ncbi:hypothetical protein DFJ73DRAFT_842585 [Zopfochytrium polystomum]|nr:hypothetical protein DFJ73DRAFT_842585 [Zopfochytrium polystomum]
MTTDDLIDALAAGTPRGDASSVRERAKTLVRSGRLTRHDRLGCVSVTPTFSLYWLREDWKDAPLFANGAPFEVYIEEAVPQQVEDEEMEQPPSIAARMAKSPSTKQGGDNDADDDKENFVARMDTSASSKPPLVLSKGEESPTTTTTTTVEEAAVTPTPAQKRRKTIGINRYGPLPPYKSPVRTPAGAGTATPRKAATPLRTPLKPYASSSPLTPASNGGSRARVFRPFKPPSSTAGACGHTTPHVGRMMLKRAGLEGASSASGSPERTLEREIQQKELLLTRIKLAESYLLNSEAAKVEALSQKWKQATCEALGEVQQLLGLQDIGPPGSAAGGGGAGGGGGSGGWRRSGFSGGFHRASSPNSGWPLMSDEMRAQCAAQFDADDADGFFERRQRRRDGGGGGGGAGDDGDNDDDDDAADLGKNAGYSEPRLYTFREIATSLGFDLALVKSDAEEDE